MAGDLERFLQQAAERLAEKVSESKRPVGQGRPNPRSNQTSQPNQSSGNRPSNPPQVQGGRGSVRRAERMPPRAEIIEAEVLGPVNPADALGPDPISDLDTRHLDPSVLHRPALARGIDQADERMSAHVRHVVGHDIVELRDASSALSRSRDSSKIAKRQTKSNPLIEMLRHKDSLKSAFIASQIFGRKFD